MPNGRQGDHPFTDIVHHGLTVFGPEIDDLVRELARMPNFKTIEKHVDTLLWDNWPHWQNVKPNYKKVLCDLRAMKAELEQQ